MLLLNGQAIGAKELCTKLGVDMEKLLNNPVFELEDRYKKIDKVNGNQIKIPARFAMPARTFIRLSPESEAMELIWAESRNYRTVKNERIAVYSPRYFTTDTAKFSSREDVDRLVFLYVNPANTFSPFGNGKSGDYKHIDYTLIAASRMKGMNDVSTAMSSIKEMAELDLLILAKGVKATFKTFNPFIDGPETKIDIVRVEMMGFAQTNATSLLEMLDNKIAKTKGQIINLVDKGIIKETTNMNMRQWKWDKGERAGNFIGDQIIDPHADALDYLLNYILGNLGQYYSDIHSVNNNISAEESAMKFLQDQKESVVVVEPSIEGLPTSFQEAMAWLGDNGFKKLPQLAKMLNEAIQGGSIHTGNINTMVAQMNEQIEESRG